jgi:hypothetical protein
MIARWFTLYLVDYIACRESFDICLHTPVSRQTYAFAQPTTGGFDPSVLYTRTYCTWWPSPWSSARIRVRELDRSPTQLPVGQARKGINHGHENDTLWWTPFGTGGYRAILKISPEVPRPKTGVTGWPGVMSLLISQV